MEKMEQQRIVEHDTTSNSATIGSTNDQSNVEERSNAEKPPSAGSATPVAVVEPEHEYIKGIKLWLVLISLTMVAFLVMMDMAIIGTAIPRITSDFHSLSDVGWYGSAYLLANCALQPLTGKLYTHLNLKYTFLAFLGIFEFGSAICGAAQSSNMLIIGRAVAGLGGSGLSNGALTILSASVPMAKRPVAQVGVIGGPLLGGALTEYASWRWCFYINLPIGVVAVIFLLLISIPDLTQKSSPDKSTLTFILSKLDAPGFVLFAPFSTMLLMALQWGGTEYPWNSPTIIGLFCGAAGTFILFLAWEYRTNEAMLPFSLLKRRIVWSSCLTVAFFFGSSLIFSYYLPIYFQAVRNVSPALSGVYILPSILTQILMSVVSGVLVGKLGYYLPWSVASAVACAIAGGLISTFTPESSTANWIGYQLLGGIGRGWGLQMPIVAMQALLEPTQIPVGMSVIVFCQSFGGTLFLTFAQTVFSQGLLNGLDRFAPEVDVQRLVVSGASAFRQIIEPDQISGVEEAYNLAINHVFYLAAGSSVAAFVFSFGMGWTDIRKKKVITPEA